jgi:hypothetical protein
MWCIIRAKEPVSNGAPCTKRLVWEQCAGVIERRLAQTKSNSPGEAPTQDESYLRSQAGVCLQWRGHERSRAAGFPRRGCAPWRPIVSLRRPNRISLLKKWRALVPRYFFQADYRGISVYDDVGEEFSTLQDAEAYATVVANELARNSAHAVAVSVLGEDGLLLAKAMTASQ